METPRDSSIYLKISCSATIKLHCNVHLDTNQSITSWSTLEVTRDIL